MKLLPLATMALLLVVSKKAAAQSCGPFESAMGSCLSTNFGAADANECWDCVRDSLPDSAYYCKTIEEEVCEALDRCACGSCADEIERYLDCAVGAATKGCPIQCNPVTSEGSRFEDTSAASSYHERRRLLDGSKVLLAVVAALFFTNTM